MLCRQFLIYSRRSTERNQESKSATGSRFFTVSHHSLRCNLDMLHSGELIMYVCHLFFGLPEWHSIVLWQALVYNSLKLMEYPSIFILLYYRGLCYPCEQKKIKCNNTRESEKKYWPKELLFFLTQPGVGRSNTMWLLSDFACVFLCLYADL